ncbi:MAG: tetratricopeptide repeat protein [Acidobacteriota bacterium]
MNRRMDRKERNTDHFDLAAPVRDEKLRVSADVKGVGLRRCIPFLAILSYLAVPMTQHAEERRLDRSLRLSQTYFDQEKYREAIAELEKVVDLNSSLPGTYYQLGYSYWKLGDFDRARDHFKRELQFKPPDPYSHYYLGRILLAEGKAAEAVEQFEKVLALAPILDVYRQAGNAYLMAGRVTDAIAVLEKEVRRAPDQGEAHYKLGRAYQRAGRREEAQRELSLARELKWQDQEIVQRLLQSEEHLKQGRTAEASAVATEVAHLQDAELLSSLGQLFGRYGLHREALNFLQQAAVLEPSRFEAHYNQGVSLVAIKEYARAAEVLQEAVKLKPDSYEAQSLLGMALVQQGKGEEALRPLRAAATLKPDNPRLMALLGLKYMEGRYYREAIESLRKAVELEPQNPEGRFLLIQAHYLNQDFERALAEARSTALKFPNLARSHFELAQQLSNMGDSEQARPLLEKSLKMDPTLVEARVSLGDVLLKIGRVEEALQAFRSALQQRPELLEAHLGSGKALLQMKRYEEAAAAMEKAIRLAPDQPQPHLHLSQAYRALGRNQEAAQESQLFIRFNRERMQRRDRNTERTFIP